ncbi:hypothetical protein E2C01_061750 [Portunus trituberculatus]|uniref:Uncharacterized protein n=1 Tax=Portunus trituberculatus TaxID=210409 RepID=A0A5B7HG60_PORTR|nr:hypothetical protein [Portunus trituberculatus]
MYTWCKNYGTKTVDGTHSPQTVDGTHAPRDPPGLRLRLLSKSSIPGVLMFPCSFYLSFLNRICLSFVSYLPRFNSSSSCRISKALLTIFSSNPSLPTHLELFPYLFLTKSSPTVVP